MIKIAFVCLGNICRSPMAEFLMKDIVKKENLEKNFKIDSYATSSYEIGNPIYPMAKQTLIKYNITDGIDYKKAMKLKSTHYDEYDLFIVMSNEIKEDTINIFGSDYDNKVHLLLEYTGENRDILDPYYTRDFEKAYLDIKNGTKALFEKLKK